MKHVQKVGLLFQTSPKVQTTYSICEKKINAFRKALAGY